MYIGNDSQQHLESMTLYRVRLDVLCDVVEIFEHMKELQCTKISDPQQVWLLYSYMCVYHFCYISCSSNIPRPPEVIVE